MGADPALRPAASAGNKLLNPTPRVRVRVEPLSLFRKSWGQRSFGQSSSSCPPPGSLGLAGAGREPSCASCWEWGAGGTESLLESQCPTSGGRRSGRGAEVTWCPRAGPAEVGLSLLTIPPPIHTVPVVFNCILGSPRTFPFMAESEEKLKSLLMKVKEESEKGVLKLNIQKTKIMASGPISSVQSLSRV